MYICLHWGWFGGYIFHAQDPSRPSPPCLSSCSSAHFAASSAAPKCPAAESCGSSRRPWPAFASQCLRLRKLQRHEWDWEDENGHVVFHYSDGLQPTSDGLQPAEKEWANDAVFFIMAIVLDCRGIVAGVVLELLACLLCQYAHHGVSGTHLLRSL